MYHHPLTLLLQGAPAMIFIDNKYTRWYFNIIAAANSRNISQYTYTEIHHIIPKSLGGTNLKNNLVNLTAKEHFVCHRLLTRMTAGAAKRKMVYAQNMMLAKTPDQKRIAVNANTYKQIKEEFSKINPFNDPAWQLKKGGNARKGVKRSAEAIENIKASWTPERRANASISSKGRKNPRTPEWTEKIRIANLGKTGKLWSEEAKLHQSLKMKGKPAPWAGQKLQCMHCLKILDKGNYTKYHGEKCKIKE